MQQATLIARAISSLRQHAGDQITRLEEYADSLKPSHPKSGTSQQNKRYITAATTLRELRTDLGYLVGRPMMMPFENIRPLNIKLAGSHSHSIINKKIDCSEKIISLLIQMGNPTESELIALMAADLFAQKHDCSYTLGEQRLDPYEIWLTRALNPTDFSIFPFRNSLADRAEDIIQLKISMIAKLEYIRISLPKPGAATSPALQIDQNAAKLRLLDFLEGEASHPSTIPVLISPVTEIEILQADLTLAKSILLTFADATPETAANNPKLNAAVKMLRDLGPAWLTDFQGAIAT